MSIMQSVQDVNAMAEEMNKDADFSIVLLSTEARGLTSGRTEVRGKIYVLCHKVLLFFNQYCISWFIFYYIFYL